jgi:hypothetical protein
LPADARSSAGTRRLSRTFHILPTFVRRPLENTCGQDGRIFVSANNSEESGFGTQLAHCWLNLFADLCPEYAMDIRIVSSLTPEDEARVASALMSALTHLLDKLPIRYAVRFETTAGKTLTRDHSPVEVPLGDASADVPADALVSFKVPEA